MEDQVVDRARRIGRTKPAFVHTLVASGTIEKKTEIPEERKSARAQSLFDRDDAPIRAMMQADPDLRLGSTSGWPLGAASGVCCRSEPRPEENSVQPTERFRILPRPEHGRIPLVEATPGAHTPPSRARGEGTHGRNRVERGS